jgi:hypothetical protein
MAAYTALDRLLGRQHGVIATRQLAGVGMTRSQADSWVRRGLFVRVRRGVLRSCGSAPTWRMAAAAAVLAAGEGAVLSHGSAARLWGLTDGRADGPPGGDPDTQPLELTAGRPRRLDGVVGHRHRLDPSEMTVRFGIPVTTIERTLLDLAERWPAGRLGRVVDDALRRGLTTLERVGRILGRRVGPGRRRWRPLRQVLSARGEGYDPGANEWEQRMNRNWERWGLPPGPRQHRVRVAGGRSYRLDRAITELRIGVEWNGRAYHGTRSGFEYDSERRSALLRAGWLILDFTPASTRQQIVATVRAACEERRRLLLLAA